MNISNLLGSYKYFPTMSFTKTAKVATDPPPPTPPAQLGLQDYFDVWATHQILVAVIIDFTTRICY